MRERKISKVNEGENEKNNKKRESELRAMKGS